MNIPYRITIELAIGDKGKTIQVTGETPDLGYDAEVLAVSESALCAITANSLLWQAKAMAESASSHATYERMRQALNLPLNQVPY